MQGWHAVDGLGAEEPVVLRATVCPLPVTSIELPERAADMRRGYARLLGEPPARPANELE